MAKRSLEWRVPLLVAVLLLVAAGAARAVERKETYDKTFALAAGGTVKVGNTNGAVEVEAWDRDEVRVQAVKTVRAGTEQRIADAMKRLEIQVDASADRVAVRTGRADDGGGFLSWLFGNHVDASVSYTVSVPRAAKVEIETVNGKLRVHGVSGAVDAETTNGSVQLTDLRGAVVASTINGAVQVELSAMPPGASMRLETTNGGIHVTVPREARLSIDAETTNGGIDISGLEASIGRHSRRHVEAEVNGGGARVRLSTTNGGIRISGGSA